MYALLTIVSILFVVLPNAEMTSTSLSEPFSAIISGKTRIFFTPPESIESLKQIFFVKDTEKIIAATEIDSVKFLIDELKKNPDKFIAFALVGNYQIFLQQMTQAGFVEGKDFLNAILFLSDAHGFPLNTYPLLRFL